MERGTRSSPLRLFFSRFLFCEKKSGATRAGCPCGEHQNPRLGRNSPFWRGTILFAQQTQPGLLFLFFAVVKNLAALNRMVGESAFHWNGREVSHTGATWSRQEAERLVNTYSDLILRLSYTYLKSTEDAKDICQTVFLKLLEKPRTFASEEHERAFIIRTAVNTCKDVLKSHWRRTTVEMDAAGEVPAPQAEEGSLLAAMELLPPKYRMVLYLYYYEGYQAREIAQMLGEKPATISTRLSRGRMQLRNLLESEGLA